MCKLERFSPKGGDFHCNNSSVYSCANKYQKCSLFFQFHCSLRNLLTGYKSWSMSYISCDIWICYILRQLCNKQNLGRFQSLSRKLDPMDFSFPPQKKMLLHKNEVTPPPVCFDLKKNCLNPIVFQCRLIYRKLGWLIILYVRVCFSIWNLVYPNKYTAYEWSLGNFFFPCCSFLCTLYPTSPSSPSHYIPQLNHSAASLCGWVSFSSYTCKNLSLDVPFSFLHCN